MGTYGLDGVLLAWTTGKLTTEQAVGQILQLLQDLEQRVAKVEAIVIPPRPPSPPPPRKRTGQV